MPAPSQSPQKSAPKLVPAPLAAKAPAKPSVDLTAMLEHVRKLTAEERQALLKEMRAPTKWDVPRDPGSGGILASIPFDAALEGYAAKRQDEWTPRAGRHYFSGLGRCFRWAWLKQKGVLCDCGFKIDLCPKHRFAPGKAEGGNGAERAFQYVLEQHYASGFEGTILKNIRFSEPVEITPDDGEPYVDHACGRSDQILVGDNLRILNFWELKTPFFWKRKFDEIVDAMGRVVPLGTALIEDSGDAPNGVVNLNQVLQLAAGAYIMRQNGNQPNQVTLVYMDRSNYGNHLEILLSPDDVEFLHTFAIWWITEHSLNLRDDMPPPSQFFMGWECGYCPFAAQCSALDKKLGKKRTIHPAMVGINDRLAATNRKD